MQIFQTKTNGSSWARWRTAAQRLQIPDRSASLEREFHSLFFHCVDWQLQQSSQEGINLGLAVQAFAMLPQFRLRRFRFDVQEAQHNRAREPVSSR